MDTIIAPANTYRSGVFALLLWLVIGQVALAKNLSLVTRTFLNNQTQREGVPGGASTPGQFRIILLTVPAGELLYVADDSAGVKIIAITDPYNPSILATLTTSGTAKDLALQGNYLFVATGAKGIDIVDVSDPTTPVLVSNYHTSGYASCVAVNDSLLAVSDWDDVEVLNFSTGSLELYGFKNTGGRVMAMNMAGNTVYSAEWMYFDVFQIESTPGPDVDYSRRKNAFTRVASGMSAIETFTMTNHGN